MNALEPLGQDLEILITNTQGLQLLRRRQHIVAACAGSAVTLTRKWSCSCRLFSRPAY